MSSPDPKASQSQSQTLESSSPSPTETKPQAEMSQDSDPSTETTRNDGDNREGDEEEEELGECGFCLFMKGGGCKDSFIAWEECIEAAEKNNEDIVDKCMDVTAALKKCMEAHSDYYEPILKAEKAAEEVAAKELEKEAALKDAEQNATVSKGTEELNVTIEVPNEEAVLKGSEQKAGAN